MGDFIGSGKVKEGQYGKFLSAFIDPEGLEKLNAAANEGFVRIVIGKRKKPSEKGYTHYIAIDDYVPQNRRNNYHKYPQEDNPRNQNTDLSDNYGPVGQDDIPF